MKRNKNTFLYIILLALLAVASYFIMNNSETTIKGTYSDFAIADTASITKIFLADKNGNSIKLVRNDDYWTVNDKYRTRNDAINMLLTTMKGLKVKAPVPKTALETQIKHLAVKSVKVEIYTTKETPDKVYYVGGATKNNQGTYMLIENSTKPYIVHLRGFFGYLSTRYFTDEILWRESWLYKTKYENIASVSLDYPKNPENSFTAVNLGDNKFELYKNEGHKKIANFDTLQVKIFISNFLRMGYEAPIINMRKEKYDSLLNVHPEKIYDVKFKDGNSRDLVLYKVKGDTPIKDQFGHVTEYDPDRMYCFFDKFSELVTIQTNTINPATKELGDFIKK